MSTTNDPTRPTVVSLAEKRREGEMKGQVAQINSYAWPCCLTCEHWADNQLRRGTVGAADFSKSPAGAQEICSLYQMKPPATVICTGCVSYTADIPF